MGAMVFIYVGVAVLCGGVAGGCAVALQADRIAKIRRRAQSSLRADRLSNGSSLEGDDRVLRYAERLTSQLFSGETKPVARCVRSKRAGATRAGRRYLERADAAGCSKSITVSAFCETRSRFTIAGALVGLLLGVVFSLEFAAVLAVAVGLLLRSLPMRSVRKAAARRSAEAERYLSDMLEVVALGLRSGLTFDRSFALYGAYFDNEFAHSCTKAYRRWSLGLSTREQSLRDFASSYDCDQLSHVVDSIVRSLKFGSALTETLEEAATQVREGYRAALAERVAKAPVKMMLPTGTLILPAMLLLVLGPILIELASGF